MRAAGHAVCRRSSTSAQVGGAGEPLRVGQLCAARFIRRHEFQHRALRQIGRFVHDKSAHQHGRPRGFMAGILFVPQPRVKGGTVVRAEEHARSACRWNAMPCAEVARFEEAAGAAPAVHQHERRSPGTRLLEDDPASVVFEVRHRQRSSRLRARAMSENNAVWSVTPRTLAACGPCAAMRICVPVCSCEWPGRFVA